MTSIYHADSNSLIEQAGMEKPQEPMAIAYPQDERRYDRDMRHYNIEIAEYNAHISSLRTIVCDESCRGIFVDNQEYVEGKDYEIKTKIQTRNSSSISGRIVDFAIPLQPVSEDELWKNAAHVLTETKNPDLSKENSLYWNRWSEYYTLLIGLKDKGYSITKKHNANHPQ